MAGAIFSQTPFRVCPTAPLSVWLTEPLGYATQFTAPCRLDESVAEFITRTYWEAADALHVGPGDKLVFFHAWEQMQNHTSAARRMVMRWGVDIRRNVGRIAIHLAPQVPIFVRLAASVAASTFSSLGVAVDIHFGGDVAQIIRDLGIEAVQPEEIRNL